MSAEPLAPLRITDLPADERPRERLMQFGPQALSNAELLAILLRVGGKGESAVRMAERILKQLDGPAGLLRRPLTDLTSLHGIGLAKAAQIKAAVELGYRVARAELGDRPQITSPADAANLLLIRMGGLEQEEVHLLLLDTKNRVLDTLVAYRGSLNASAIRVAELFRAAVRQNAASILVAHNHPSGDPTPSPEDIAVTRNLVQAGCLLDIPLLDHLIIGQGRWVSLKERGLGF